MSDMIPLVLGADGLPQRLQPTDGLVVSAIKVESTFANLPSAASYSGHTILVTDVGVNGSLWRSNGTIWAPVSAIDMAKIGASISLISGTTQNIYLSAFFPTNLLKIGSEIEITLAGEKGGTAENTALKYYIGTTGTTSDTAIVQSPPFIPTTSKRAHVRTCLRIDSNTQAILLHAAANGTTEYGANTVGWVRDTIPNITLNGLYISVGINFSGSSDTGTVVAGRITLHR
jgi:hypothetical protein